MNTPDRIGNAIYWMLLGAGLMASVAICALPADACDSEFIQEPTVTEPEQEYVDTIAGLYFRSWSFPTGKSLTTIRAILELTHEQSGDDSLKVETNPFMYIIREKGKFDLRYTDKVGKGECVDITRY